MSLAHSRSHLFRLVMSQTLILYQKVLSLFHGNLSALLHVQDIIINKINVKVVIAQNDTDLSCIKLGINVLKYCVFVKHFLTLISSLTVDKSVPFRAIMTFTNILFIILYRIYKRTFQFPWNSDQTFTIAFLHIKSLTKVLICTIMGWFHGINPLD